MDLSYYVLKFGLFLYNNPLVIKTYKSFPLFYKEADITSTLAF